MTIMRTSFLLLLVSLSPALGQSLRWDFESESDLQQWVPNSHLSNLEIRNGILSAETTGWDPFLLCRTVTIPASASQYVVVRLKADRPGIGELFWSGELEGRYGGLTERKKVRFSVKGQGVWQEIAIFPFWHTEKAIRQLRLDLYEGARFEIDWVHVRRWGEDRAESSVCVWGFGGDVSRWRVHPEAPELFAARPRIGIADKPWVTVQLASDQEEVASILWACEGVPGLQSEEFPIEGDGEVHSYNIKMADNSRWRGTLVAFGIRLPQNAETSLESIRMGDEPFGPGELDLAYFGFENGLNRAGRPCRLMAQVVNRGGAAQGIRTVNLILPKGLQLVSEPKRLSHSGVEHGEVASFMWEITAEKAGDYEVGLHFGGKGNIPPSRAVSLEFTEPVDLPAAPYVPEPRPVKTGIDVCAFYFPGWGLAEKWDCVRKVAPNRKPLLGYYDESNPECVDWQIKWAVENGISCFLVDWYWVQGRQQLTHWFEAYRKAKYRDLLKVAIMWANHNPPNTHSAEDWLNVTKHWVEHYFPLESYYHIDGKPAVFIWNPQGIRSDLGSTETVRKAFDQSQAIARDAGYEGITFIAMGSNFGSAHIQAMLSEGYGGVTTYHEWGPTVDGLVSKKRFDYVDVVRNSAEAWREKNEAAGSLCYYPLVDTGWDSRPWHGDRAMAILGRTPPLFEQLLRQAKSFCEGNDKPIVIFGPLNEWGEGSYIEPCTEFGFEMLEAVRRVFADEPATGWPVNISPQDVGLGPYDYPEAPAKGD